jgi:MYXO-CTERM domain-containing protein
LDLNRLSDSYLLLSGAATFSTISLVGVHADSWISFATGSTATFTATDENLTSYTTLVNDGKIRVNGAQATMSQFQVTGDHTLSLVPEPTAALLGSLGLLTLLRRRRQ